MNGLMEIRLHGRGGQGVVSAAKVMAEAAFREGKNVQAFSLHGAERRGAPVTAFARIGNTALLPRCQIQHPDFVIVFDTLLPRETFCAGVKEKGVYLINCPDAKANKLAFPGVQKVWFVDAAKIAATTGLLSTGIPIINAIMLGALARIGLFQFASLKTVLREKLPGAFAVNLTAAEKGYESVKETK
ncbi:MAG: pyruvate ferredoxin oxidoreductase [Firmicutes bacterium]|nr:pyruvate ferredoxin oxidoreductase [Bacillota bacterium]